MAGSLYVNGHAPKGNGHAPSTKRVLLASTAPAAPPVTPARRGPAHFGHGRSLAERKALASQHYAEGRPLYGPSRAAVAVSTCRLPQSGATASPSRSRRIASLSRCLPPRMPRQWQPRRRSASI